MTQFSQYSSPIPMVFCAASFVQKLRRVPPSAGVKQKEQESPWRWQTRATQKHAKIAPIRRVSFQYTEFHFAEFQITDA